MDLTNLDKERKQRRKSSLDLGTMVYGKVPPQAKDLEEAVLGAIMLEKNAFDTVIEILKPECFYVEAHQRIFRAMQSLANKSQPIDILTVVEELRFKEELEMARKALLQVIAEAKRLHSAGVPVDDAVTQAKFGDLETWTIKSSQAATSIRRVYLELDGKLK